MIINLLYYCAIDSDLGANIHQTTFEQPVFRNDRFFFILGARFSPGNTEIRTNEWYRYGWHILIHKLLYSVGVGYAGCVRLWSDSLFHRFSSLFRSVHMSLCLMFSVWYTEVFFCIFWHSHSSVGEVWRIFILVLDYCNLFAHFVMFWGMTYHSHWW